MQAKGVKKWQASEFRLPAKEDSTPVGQKRCRVASAAYQGITHSGVTPVTTPRRPKFQSKDGPVDF